LLGEGALDRQQLIFAVRHRNVDVLENNSGNTQLAETANSYVNPNLDNVQRDGVSRNSYCRERLPGASLNVLNVGCLLSLVDQLSLGEK
jgi:hypothetical protein